MNKVISTPIHKKDKPYPIIFFKNKLYLQTGTLCVYSEEDTYKIVNGKNYKEKI